MSSQPFLVISQFSQFSVITAHISADRYLSKKFYEDFYSPWPPLTFKTIIIFHVKPFFTLPQRPTVNSRYALTCNILHNFGVRFRYKCHRLNRRSFLFEFALYIERESGPLIHLGLQWNTLCPCSESWQIFAD